VISFVVVSIRTTDFEWCPETQTAPKPKPIPCGCRTDHWSTPSEVVAVWWTTALGDAVGGLEVTSGEASGGTSDEVETGVAVQLEMVKASTSKAVTRAGNSIDDLSGSSARRSAPVQNAAG